MALTSSWPCFATTSPAVAGRKEKRHFVSKANIPRAKRPSFFPEASLSFFFGKKKNANEVFLVVSQSRLIQRRHIFFFLFAAKIVFVSSLANILSEERGSTNYELASATRTADKRFRNTWAATSFDQKFHSYVERWIRSRSRTSLGSPTDYRYECAWKRVRVGTGQFFKWIQAFTI